MWTDPDTPSNVVIDGAVSIVESREAFRTEVERRLFNDYIEDTRPEYLEYASDPSYAVSSDMLPELSGYAEVWTVFSPTIGCVSIDEPSEFYPSNRAEITLSFSVAFDVEHDFHVIFRDGHFSEVTR